MHRLVSADDTDLPCHHGGNDDAGLVSDLLQEAKWGFWTT